MPSASGGLEVSRPITPRATPACAIRYRYAAQEAVPALDPASTVAAPVTAAVRHRIRGSPTASNFTCSRCVRSAHRGRWAGARPLAGPSPRDVERSARRDARVVGADGDLDVAGPGVLEQRVLDAAVDAGDHVVL